MAIEIRVRLTDAVKEERLRGKTGTIVWDESDYPHSTIVSLDDDPDGPNCQLGFWEFEVIKENGVEIIEEQNT